MCKVSWWCFYALSFLCNGTYFALVCLFYFQVDLIDMSMKPSDGYRYIVHLMDHFSKFHMVSSVERKTTTEINQCLIKMFGTIGLPHIIQTDNGTEFQKLADIFRGKIIFMFANTRPWRTSVQKSTKASFHELHRKIKLNVNLCHTQNI